MTGIYRISTPRSGSLCFEEQFKKSWSAFTATCLSLHADGLNYAVEFGDGLIKIHAHGTPIKRAVRPVAVPRHNPPALLESKRIKRELSDAQRAAANIRSRLRDKTERFQSWRDQYRAEQDPETLAAAVARRVLLGKWLAKRLALSSVGDTIKPADYKELEALLGYKMQRVSKMGSRYRDAIDNKIRLYVLRYLLNVRELNSLERHQNEYRPPVPFPIEEYQLALLDIEKQQYAPGLGTMREAA